MCYLFLPVNCLQFHQIFGLVIVVVTANSGKVIWEVLFVAFEASFLNYQMASMLVGEVEHINQSLCCNWVRNGFEDASDEDVRAFSFELIRRWWVRTSSSLILRFNGKDKLQLSTVKLMKIYSSVPFNLRCTSLADRWESHQDTIGEHTLDWGPQRLGCGCAAEFRVLDWSAIRLLVQSSSSSLAASSWAFPLYVANICTG